MNVDMSQGSHFFHNLTELPGGLLLRAAPRARRRTARHRLGLARPAAGPARDRVPAARRAAAPLRIRVDGRRGRGRRAPGRGGSTHERAGSRGRGAAGTAGAGQGAQLPLPDRRDPARRRTGRVEEMLRAVAERPAAWAGSTRPSCVAHVILRGQDLRPAGFRETPWKQSAPIVVVGERHRRGLRPLHRGDARGRRGAVPQGGAPPPRRDRRPAGPGHPAARAARGHRARRPGRAGAPAGAAPDWRIILDLRAAHRPEPLPPARPQDAQPPGVERHRGRQAAPARPVGPARGGRRARRREPADAAQRADGRRHLRAPRPSGWPPTT